MTKRVVNTRLGDELYEKLSVNAKKRRVTISNLIRNIVEDSLALSGEVLEAVDEKIKSHLHKEDHIVGYNAITLSKNSVCNICLKEQLKGTEANIAYLDNSAKTLIVCNICKKS
jgi:hypothetical protein